MLIRLSSIALVGFQIGIPGFGLPPRHQTNLIWKPARVRVDWEGPKSKLEPMGSPHKYSWDSNKGVHFELLPELLGDNQSSIVRVNGVDVQCQSIPSMKNGWPSQFSTPWFPCGYNSISEISIPTVQFCSISHWSICLVQWPNNAMGYPQTNHLLIFKSESSSAFSAIAFEGDKATINLLPQDGLALIAMGIARPQLDYESWAQEIRVRVEAKQYEFNASPLRSSKAIR